MHLEHWLRDILSNFSELWAQNVITRIFLLSRVENVRAGKKIVKYSIFLSQISPSKMHQIEFCLCLGSTPSPTETPELKALNYVEKRRRGSKFKSIHGLEEIQGLVTLEKFCQIFRFSQIPQKQDLM